MWRILKNWNAVFEFRTETYGALLPWIWCCICHSLTYFVFVPLYKFTALWNVLCKKKKTGVYSQTALAIRHINMYLKQPGHLDKSQSTRRQPKWLTLFKRGDSPFPQSSLWGRGHPPSKHVRCLDRRLIWTLICFIADAVCEYGMVKAQHKHLRCVLNWNYVQTIFLWKHRKVYSLDLVRLKLAWHQTAVEMTGSWIYCYVPSSVLNVTNEIRILLALQRSVRNTLYPLTSSTFLQLATVTFPFRATWMSILKAHFVIFPTLPCHSIPLPLYNTQSVSRYGGT